MGYKLLTRDKPVQNLKEKIVKYNVKATIEQPGHNYRITTANGRLYYNIGHETQVRDGKRTNV